MNARRPTSVKRGAMIATQLASPLLLAPVLTGCVIPVPVESVSNEVTEQSVAAIKPETSTRADVLLLLGDPTLRGERDGHFVYSWRQTHGGAIVAFPYPIATGVGMSCHCLVVRFAPNGVVAKVRVFHGEAHLEGNVFGADVPAADICTRDAVLKNEIKEWLAETPGPVQ
jgi:outer membrane protein assembly factor BamE (lipoprotein component of BamABCDE complex)